MPVAFITGGGSALGEGITRTLTARGWTVVVSDIDIDRARLVADVAPTQTQAAQLDTTDRAAIKTVIAQAMADHSRIDALVNASGGMRGLGITKQDFAAMTPETWTRLIDVNLHSVLNVTHAVLPHMIAAKSGVIVSIAASRGLRGGAQASIYSAAKAAIIVFSQSLAQEVGRHGIRVNTIAPGNAQARWKTPAQESTRSPLGRQATGDDVGRAVAFLLSDDAKHITGACLDVSGGTTLH